MVSARGLVVGRGGTIVLTIAVAAVFVVLFRGNAFELTSGQRSGGELPPQVSRDPAAITDSPTATPSASMWVYDPIESEVEALTAAGRSKPDSVMITDSAARLMSKEDAEQLVGSELGYPDGIPTWLVAMWLYDETSVSDVIFQPMGQGTPSDVMIHGLYYAYDATTGVLIGQGRLDEESYAAVVAASNSSITISTATFQPMITSGTLSPEDLTDTPNQ